MRKASSLLWLLGYCVIEITRGDLEEFLNLCMRYGFGYYSIVVDESTRRVKIIISLFERARIFTACRMWQIRVKLIARGGMPSILYKCKGRWGILIGAVLAIAIYILSQSVIWRIDVLGNERLTREEVIDSLEKNGMRVGSFISSIETGSVEHRVMINDDNIAWMAINIVGTVARVEIIETIDTEIKDKNIHPANVVSSFDAQIIEMEIYSGFLAVKEGDFVRRGELLISGVYKEGKSPLRFSRASGRILGKVLHKIEVEIPMIQEKKVPTGEKFEQKTLIFFGNTIKFFRNYRNLSTSCDIINYLYILNPFSLGELPICVSVEEYYPYEAVAVEISEDEAIAQAYEALRIRIDDELPEAQILKKTLNGEFVDGKYVLTCNVVAICNIARQIEFEVVYGD